MLRGGRVRAWVTAHPWNDVYELRLVHDAGGRYYAASVEGGEFKYVEVGEGSQVEPAMRLGEGEIDALLEALKQQAKPVDATVEALRDTKEIRDRLLTLIERRWK